MIQEIYNPFGIGVVKWSNGVNCGVVTNTVTYGMKTACARLLAGDMSSRPAFIGYMVGPTGGFTPLDTDDIGTIQSIVSGWGTSGNMFIFPLATIPSVTPADNTGTPAEVTFNAVSMTDISGNVSTNNLFISSGKSTFVGGIAPGTGDVVQAVALLGRPTNNNGQYQLLAWANLLDGNSISPMKTSGRELAVYWTITLQ